MYYQFGQTLICTLHVHKFSDDTISGYIHVYEVINILHSQCITFTTNVFVSSFKPVRRGT